VLLTEELRVQIDAFQAIADSKFCYLDPVRRHASARFLSGLYEGDGLCSLTGQLGIGKTTLLRHLAEQLATLDGALILCPTHVLACRTETTLADVFGSCEAKLGWGESGTALLKAAKRLQQLVESNCSPILLLDDVDLLDDAVLEVIITMIGLQDAGRRLMSVLLAGHPSIVRRVSMITGNQDMLGAGRAIELKPVSEPDVARLIHHRLRTAGLPEDAISPDAIAHIARHSAGVPGAVVRVCRRAMQIAENLSRKSVTTDIVAEAIGEEISDVQRESLRPEPVGSVPTRTMATESSPPLAALRASITARVQSPDIESRRVPPSKPRGSAPVPEPSLVREPHQSIPEVIVGHDTLFERVRHRELGRRLKLMLARTCVFLVALAAGLAVLFGDHYELANRTRTSPIDGPVGNVGTSPAYDSREDPAPWRQPATPPESVTQGAGPNAYTLDSPLPLPSPTKDATKGAPGTTPLTETAAISETANDKVARVQLAVRMQGLEPGPPIDLPVRLSQGQARTIYFFTQLRGLNGRSVLHRWEWNNRMMKERQLHPASESWRAYTAMTIRGDMPGSWRVSAVDEKTGKVLAEQRFEVE
jgi:type II secretory pathway predicted ATPase ExeA